MTNTVSDIAEHASNREMILEDKNNVTGSVL